MRPLGAVLLVALALTAGAHEPPKPADEAGQRAAALEKAVKEKLPKADAVKVTLEPSKDEAADTATLVVEYGKGAVPGYDAVTLTAVKRVKKDAPALTIMATHATNGQVGDVALVRYDGGGKWAITKLFELNGRKVKACSALWEEAGAAAEKTFPTEPIKRDE